MSDVESYEELDVMLTGIQHNWYRKLMGRLLPTLIKIVFIRTSHLTSPVGCESNGSMILCFNSCTLGKPWSVQPQVNGIPSNRRLTIVSAMSDVCGASNSTWSDIFIESTSSPMAIASGMALTPVMISLLLQRCLRTSGGKLSHYVYTSINCTLLSMTVRVTECGGSGDCKIKW